MSKDSRQQADRPASVLSGATGVAFLEAQPPAGPGEDLVTTPGQHVLFNCDGRRLTFQVSGDPNGQAVFLLHGTPGSGIGPKPRGIKLHRLGVRLVTYDRPGYGGSDRHRGRFVRDAADDVAA